MQEGPMQLVAIKAGKVLLDIPMNICILETRNFTFIEKPKSISNGDTVIYDANRTGVITGEMTLMNSKLHGNNTYKFIRVREY